MNSLVSLLTEQDILPSVSADSRKAALIALAKRLAEQTGIDHHDIFEGIIERERLGSTGVGHGVAIPHTRIEGLERPIGALARLITPVDFDAIDDEHCDLVFMLIAPESAGADHLRALARVSRAFRAPAIRDALRSAASQAEMFAILCPDTADVSPTPEPLQRRA